MRGPREGNEGEGPKEGMRGRGWDPGRELVKR